MPPHREVLVAGRSLHQVPQGVDRVVPLVVVFLGPGCFEHLAGFAGADARKGVGGVVPGGRRACRIEGLDEHGDGLWRGVLQKRLAGGVDQGAVVRGQGVGSELAEGFDVDLSDGSQHVGPVGVAELGVVFQQLGGDVLVADLDQRFDDRRTTGRRVGQVLEQHRDGSRIASPDQQRGHGVVRRSRLEPLEHVFDGQLLAVLVGPRGEDCQCRVASGRMGTLEGVTQCRHQLGVPNLGQCLQGGQGQFRIAARGVPVNRVCECRSRIPGHGRHDVLTSLGVGVAQHLQQRLVGRGISRRSQAVESGFRQRWLIAMGEVLELLDRCWFSIVPKAHHCGLGNRWRLVGGQGEQQRQVLGLQPAASTGQCRRSCQWIPLLDLLEQLAAGQHAIRGVQRSHHRQFNGFVNSLGVGSRGPRGGDPNRKSLEWHAAWTAGSATCGSPVGNCCKVQFADCGRDRGKRGAAGDRPPTGQRGGLVHPAVDPGFDGGRLVGEIDDRTNDSGGGQRVELVDQRGDVDGVDGTADRDQSQAATWSDLPRLHGQSAAGAGVQIDGHGCLAQPQRQAEPGHLGTLRQSGEDQPGRSAAAAFQRQLVQPLQLAGLETLVSDLE